MKELEIYTPKSIDHLLNNRVGEEIWASRFHFVKPNETLSESLTRIPADFVVFAIPEDIGVRANYGRPGAARAWDATLKRLLNVQVNPDNQPCETLLLGHFDFSEMEEEIKGSTDKKPSDLGPFVERIDRVVSQLVATIVSAGKIPIVVGGGHNNAYGMIKGTASALNRPVNILNIDAHADLRPMDYRHSGNGFTYALHENLLNHYFIFGLHENYNSEAIYLEMLNRPDQVSYASFESMVVRRNTELKSEVERATEFICGSDFGLELDLDCIENIPSSALTPSGFCVNDTRRLVHQFASNPNLRYVHLCEAAPGKGSETDEIITGKLITYLLTDILRSRS